jgi:hypothetical protein
MGPVPIPGARPAGSRRIGGLSELTDLVDSLRHRCGPRQCLRSWNTALSASVYGFITTAGRYNGRKKHDGLEDRRRSA